MTDNLPVNAGFENAEIENDRPVGSSETDQVRNWLYAYLFFNRILDVSLDSHQKWKIRNARQKKLLELNYIICQSVHKEFLIGFNHE